MFLEDLKCQHRLEMSMVQGAVHMSPRDNQAFYV